MRRLNGNYKPVFRRTLKQKNKKTLKKLALAFAIVLVSGGLYLQYLQPYTLEAKQRVQLESTRHQLLETKKNLQKTQTQSVEQDKTKQKQIDDLNKQLQETQRQLQAKRASQTAYASSVSESPAPVSSGGSCSEWMAQAGIPSTHATNKLIVNESGCKPWARNPDSGACGIPQAYPCSKLPCSLDNSGAVCQLRWMQNYVSTRYGSWEQALSFWYAQCPTPSGCWY